MLASVKLLCNKTLLTLCLSFKELSRAQKNSSNLWSAMTAGCQPVVSACNSPIKLLLTLETTLKANTIQTHSPTTVPNVIPSRTPGKLWRFMCESVRLEKVQNKYPWLYVLPCFRPCGVLSRGPQKLHCDRRRWGLFVRYLPCLLAQVKIWCAEPHWVPPLPKLLCLHMSHMSEECQHEEGSGPTLCILFKAVDSGSNLWNMFFKTGKIYICHF